MHVCMLAVNALTCGFSGYKFTATLPSCTTEEQFNTRLGTMALRDAHLSL